MGWMEISDQSNNKIVNSLETTRASEMIIHKSGALQRGLPSPNLNRVTTRELTKRRDA